MSHNLSHAGDGSLLDLLVYILSFQSLETALVDVASVAGEVKSGGGTVQGPQHFDQQLKQVR